MNDQDGPAFLRRVPVAAFAAAVAVHVVLHRVVDDTGAGRFLLIASAIHVIWWLQKQPFLDWTAANERTFLRARFGNNHASAIDEAVWAEAEHRPRPPAAAAQSFRRRRGTLAVWFGCCVLLVVVPIDAALGPDANPVSIFVMGAAVLAGARALARIVLARGAVRVTPDAVRLGYAAGFFPSVTLPRSEILRVGQSERRLVFLCSGRRAYSVRTTQLDDVAGVVAALAEPDARGQRISTAKCELLVLDPQGDDLAEARVERRRDAADAAQRNRTRGDVVMVAVGVLLTLPGALWFLSQWNENSRLATEGTAIEATVTAWSSHHRNPTVTVGFDVDGERYERTLWQPARGRRTGDVVRVLVDADDPQLVRTPDRRNFHSLTSLAVFVPGFILLGGFLGFASRIHSRSPGDARPLRVLYRRVNVTQGTTKRIELDPFAPKDGEHGDRRSRLGPIGNGLIFVTGTRVVLIDESDEASGFSTRHFHVVERSG